MDMGSKLQVVALLVCCGAYLPPSAESLPDIQGLFPNGAFTPTSQTWAYLICHGTVGGEKKSAVI